MPRAWPPRARDARAAAARRPPPGSAAPGSGTGARSSALQAEIAAQPLERVERDAPERRELAARDREQAALAALEHRLAPRRRGLALALRQHAHAGEAREDAVVLDDARLDRRARLAARSGRCPRASTSSVARVALVGLVGRADEQRALPGVRELHAPALERRRQRGLPRLVEAHDQVRALGEAQRARRGGIGHAPHLVHPRPGGVDDAGRLDRERRRRRARRRTRRRSPARPPAAARAPRRASRCARRRAAAARATAIVMRASLVSWST